ncbi:MAG TPA: glycosyltransferase, partial [Thermoanaerobaculia bacterium]|nr:glycosyltransferase [Thermoanaerobaculia bacterium]
MTTHLAAFLITYRRPAVAAATLEAMLAQSLPPQRILVLDNGATPDLAERVRHHAGQGVSYVALEGNLGPAGAAARGLRILAESDAQWIAWGDDDDPPMTGDTFARLVEMGNAYGDEVAAVGAVGSRWDWRRGEVQRLADEELGRGPIDVDVIAGSSQLLVRANTVRQHGVPDARLFFGFEEPEYCLRLGRAGRRLLVDGELAFAYRRQAGRLALPEHRSLIPAYSPSTL